MKASRFAHIFAYICELRLYFKVSLEMTPKTVQSCLINA